MITKRRVMVTIDKTVHDEARKVLRDAGIKFSSFVEIVTKGLVDSQSKAFKDMCEDMTKGFINEATSMKKGKKER